jgi:acetoin utilization deacetylase AcuC-like enzyme
MQRMVLPALERYRPQLIIVACGYDASGVDPLGRMLLHSDSYRELTRLTREAAERLCDGKLVLVHEGGYAEAYVPFCGLAAIEALSGIRTDVQDPLLAMLESQQPDAQTVAFQKTLIDQLV